MLNGKNILLRPLQSFDLGFLISIENNTDNWQFGSVKKKFTTSELESYIKNSSEDILISKQFRYVIEFKNIQIGFIDLYDYKNLSVSIGIIIISEYREKGFGKEALNLLTNYCFNKLGVNKIHAKIKSKNIASLCLFNSCGFNLKERKRDLYYFTKLAKI